MSVWYFWSLHSIWHVLIKGNLDGSLSNYKNLVQLPTHISDDSRLAAVTSYSGDDMIFNDKIWFTSLIFISSVLFYSEVKKTKDLGSFQMSLSFDPSGD